MSDLYLQLGLIGDIYLHHVHVEFSNAVIDAHSTYRRALGVPQLHFLK